MIELTFLGTRGEIQQRSRRHRRHSALLVAHGRQQIMIDCGADWRGSIGRIAPAAIVLTHAHPDHAFGLADGAACPVYAPEQTWQTLPAYPIRRKEVLPLRGALTIGGMQWEAFPVEHSTRAPAVGYRIGAGGATLFYVPDVVAIVDRAEALKGISLYVGDGATITRSMVRRSGSALVGHTSIRSQLVWCAKEGVGKAVFTHCGTEIVGGDERRIGPRVRQIAREMGVDARIAHDGLRLRLEAGAD
jgi:phosphoribosyl 1,2-cyclic phosphodiesterase